MCGGGGGGVVMGRTGVQGLVYPVLCRPSGPAPAAELQHLYNGILLR